MYKTTVIMLARALGKDKRTIQRWALKQQWPCTQTPGLGGQRKVFTFNHLPQKIKCTIAVYIKNTADYSVLEPSVAGCDQQLDKLLKMLLPTAPKKNWLSSHPFYHRNPPLPQQTLADDDSIRSGLLMLAIGYARDSKIGKINSYDQFAKLYNHHELPLQPAVYQARDRLSRISLLRWEKSLQQPTLTRKPALIR